MKNSLLTLFLEITKKNITFYVLQKDNQENFKILYRLNTKIPEANDYKFFDIEKVTEIVKKHLSHRARNKLYIQRYNYNSRKFKSDIY